MPPTAYSSSSSVLAQLPPTFPFSTLTLEMSRRVSFSPDAALKLRGGPDDKIGEIKQKSVVKVWIFKIPNGSTTFSPASFFRRIGGKVTGALPLTQSQRRRCCSRKVSSATLLRSHSYAETIDSQRAEAIEDCIEFLNSSASLQRSSSVSSS